METVNCEARRGRTTCVGRQVLRTAGVLCAAFLVWASFSVDLLAPAAWLALVPWFMALRGTRGRSGFLVGLAYGFLCWLLVTWWIKVGAAQWLGLSGAGAWLVLCFFCLYHGLPYALFGLYRRVGGEGRWAPLSHAAVLTALVYFFPGLFPASIANALYAQPVLIQTADLGGVPFLFFLMALFGGLVEGALYRLRHGKRILGESAAALLVVAAVLAYGVYRIEEQTRLAARAGEAATVTVTAIQPNLPVNEDYLSPNGRGKLNAAIALTAEAARRNPEAELLVWPEVPLTMSCECGPDSGTAQFVRKLGKDFLLECVESAGKPNRYHNAAILIHADGSCGQKYIKLRLFPFAEYLPLEETLPFLRRFLPEVLYYRPGDRVVLLTTARGKRIIPSLCYEGLFPDTVRRGVEQGGGLLVSLADDAWFGGGPAGKLHLSVLLFRTVESRVPLVRVTNSGYGAFVRASGEIVPGTVTPQGRPAVTTAGLNLLNSRSPYVLVGDAFLYLAGLYLVFTLARRFRRVVKGPKNKFQGKGGDSQ